MDVILNVILLNNKLNRTLQILADSRIETWLKKSDTSRIRGFHGGKAKDDRLLGCRAT